MGVGYGGGIGDRGGVRVRSVAFSVRRSATVRTLAAVAMPPSHATVASQPASFISLAQLGVTEELFERVASSQGLAKKAGVRMEEIGFVLADKSQVEDPGFEPSVSLFVNATGTGTGAFRYGKGRQMVRVSVMHHGSRDDSLAAALPAVMRALSQGHRVCVHCRQSFHRGPVLYAALCRALFGTNAQMAMDTLGEHRFIWWEHLCGRHTGSQLSGALQWAGRLRSWLSVVASSQVLGATAKARAKLLPASKVKGQGVASSQAPRYVYRAMTRDLSEFDDDHPLPTWRGEELAYEMLRAVDQGSKYESAWLHCSWKFAQARNWRMQGRTRWGHMDSVICRIDVHALQAWALSQDPSAGQVDFERGLSVGQLVDMSHGRCMAHFDPYERSPRVDALFGALRRSKADKEVLLCWRGHLPKRFFEVVDQQGLYVRNLEDLEEVTLYSNVL